MTDSKQATQTAKTTNETGRVVGTLTFDTLEDRIAPSMTKLPTDPRVVNAK